MKKEIAVLIIHGLASNPIVHIELAEYLETFYDVYLYTLPGHDGRILSHPKKEDWIRVSEEQIENLYRKGYKTIYVIGHSMGGVIATYLASKYDRIKKLVLEAPAFIYNPKQNIKMLKYYSAKFVINAVTKFTLNTSKEFRALVEKYKNSTYSINIPTLIIQGTDDILVPIRSSINAYEEINSKIKYLILVNDMPHAIFRSKQKDEVALTIRHFLLDKNFNYKKYEELLNK